MNLAKIDEVIKASPAIQIQSKITHLQRRAWNVLLANAYNDWPNTDIIVSVSSNWRGNSATLLMTPIISRRH